jgi:hypothetical protein
MRCSYYPPKSCANPWSESGDRELDLDDLTRGFYSSLPALSTGLTSVTGLTGKGHRSDRCSSGSKPCKFPLCVFMSFGSEGCVLVSRTSSTQVATWSWPTLVVESETCVGSHVHFVGASISFEKNFYRLPSTPPLWFAVSVLQLLDSDDGGHNEDRLPHDAAGRSLRGEISSSCRCSNAALTAIDGRDNEECASWDGSLRPGATPQFVRPDPCSGESWTRSP